MKKPATFFGPLAALFQRFKFQAYSTLVMPGMATE